MVKNPAAMREIWVQSLDWEDPLEEGMATHSSVLAWRIPVDKEAWRATVHAVSELDTTEWLILLHFHFQVCHSFSSKKQLSFNFMAAVTIHNDFGAQEKKNLILPFSFLYPLSSPLGSALCKNAKRHMLKANQGRGRDWAHAK